MIESQVEEVKKIVGWTFVDAEYTGSGLTIRGCIGICTEKRSIECKWNGVHFHPSDA